jgi:predicted nucleic acid-binding protein
VERPAKRGRRFMTNGSKNWNGGVRDDGRASIDTNILVYAHDPSDPVKHESAIRLIAQLSDEGRLVLSTQVFNEFAWTMMRRKGERWLATTVIAELLRGIAATCEVVAVTPEITLRALDAIPRHGFSFWDALIWAAAKENGVGIVYTEDFQHGRDIEGVRIINPFATS